MQQHSSSSSCIQTGNLHLPNHGNLVCVMKPATREFAAAMVGGSENPLHPTAQAFSNEMSKYFSWDEASGKLAINFPMPKCSMDVASIGSTFFENRSRRTIPEVVSASLGSMGDGGRIEVHAQLVSDQKLRRGTWGAFITMCNPGEGTSAPKTYQWSTSDMRSSGSMEDAVHRLMHRCESAHSDLCGTQGEELVRMCEWDPSSKGGQFAKYVHCIHEDMQNID